VRLVLDRVLLKRIASLAVVVMGRLRRCDTFRINRYQSADALFEPPHRLRVRLAWVVARCFDVWLMFVCPSQF
jgi:hypothetical protein